MNNSFANNTGIEGIREVENLNEKIKGMSDYDVASNQSSSSSLNTGSKKISFVKEKIYNELKKHKPYVIMELYLGFKKDINSISNEFAKIGFSNNQKITKVQFLSVLDDYLILSEGEQNYLINDLNYNDDPINYYTFIDKVNNAKMEDLQEIKYNFNIDNNDYLKLIKNEFSKSGLNIDQILNDENKENNYLSKQNFNNLINGEKLWKNQPKWDNFEIEYVFDILSKNQPILPKNDFKNFLLSNINNDFSSSQNSLTNNINSNFNTMIDNNIITNNTVIISKEPDIYKNEGNIGPQVQADYKTNVNFFDPNSTTQNIGEQTGVSWMQSGNIYNNDINSMSGFNPMKTMVNPNEENSYSNLNFLDKIQNVKDKNEIIYQNKYKQFRQADIQHLKMLCDFLADIIVDELNSSIKDFWNKHTTNNDRILTLNEIKSILDKDMDINVDEDDSMLDFFNFILEEDLINGQLYSKTDKIIQVFYIYSDKGANEAAENDLANIQNIPSNEISNEVSIPEIIIKEFANFLNGNKVRFSSIFPSIDMNSRELVEIEIDDYTFKQGLQNAHYPMEQEKINKIMEYFDPSSKQKIKAISLINEIRRFVPNYFNEPFQNAPKVKELNSSPQVGHASAFKAKEKIFSLAEAQGESPNDIILNILNVRELDTPISVSDFASAVASANIGITQEEILDIFDVIGKDGEGKVKVEDLLRFFSPCQLEPSNHRNLRRDQENLAKIAKIYEFYDKIKKGSISKDDFAKGLRNIDKRLTDADIDFFLSKIDPEKKSSSVERNAFVAVAYKLVEEIEYTRDLEKKDILKQFKSIDINNTGYLSESEIRYVINNNILVEIKSELVDELIKYFVQNYGELIDITDFYKALVELGEKEKLNKQNEVVNDDLGASIRSNALDYNNKAMSLEDTLTNDCNNIFDFKDKIHSKKFNSIFGSIPLAFAPSLIMREQMKGHLLPSEYLKPKRDGSGVIFLDIKPSLEKDKNVNSNVRQLKENPTLINWKLEFEGHATGVPFPEESLFNEKDSQFKILGRFIKIALRNKDKKIFVSNAVSIECKGKKGNPDRWYFDEDKEKFNNNILIRYNNPDYKSIEIVFEFVMLIQNTVYKNTDEVSCAWTSMDLFELNKKKSMKLAIKSRSPLTEDSNPNIEKTTYDIISKISTILEGKIKPEIKFNIKPFSDYNSTDKKLINYLPNFLVCHRLGLEIIAIYRKIIGEFYLNHPLYGKEYINASPLIMSNFLFISDHPDLFQRLCELWRELVADAATSSQRRDATFLNEAFENLVNRVSTAGYKFYDEIDNSDISENGRICRDENYENLMKKVESFARFDKEKKYNREGYTINDLGEMKVWRIEGDRIELD